MTRLGFQLVPLLIALPVVAQMHHVDKPEQVTRAVSVYEWTGDLGKPTSARLVPVSLFLSGEFQNAGTYLAKPVPLALDVGNVYSIEKSGEPEGTLDVTLARNLKSERAAADDNTVGSWYGYGRFQGPQQEKPKKLKPTAQPVQVAASEDDDRPHFVAARPDSDTEVSTAKPQHTPSAEGDSERPTLGRREETADDSKKPKKPKKEKPAGYVTGIAGGLNDDPDRPTLRKGKGEEEEVPPLTGLPAEMKQAVAVSDPSVPAEHVFTRGWESSSERTQTQSEMQALAKKTIQEYLTANALVPAAAPAAAVASHAAGDSPVAGGDSGAPPKLQRTPKGVNTATHGTTTPVAAARKISKAGKPAPLVSLSLMAERIEGFQLSYGGLPTFVYSAQAPAATRNGTAVTAYVTVVAQRLPAGDLQVALRSVTDSGHLNRVPWLRFVDAVDADGSHRASLLFEQRHAQSRQFALYRLVTAQAEPVFTSGLLE